MEEQSSMSPLRTRMALCEQITIVAQFEGLDRGLSLLGDLYISITMSRFQYVRFVFSE